jgi:hypothetical protein
MLKVLQAALQIKVAFSPQREGETRQVDGMGPLVSALMRNPTEVQYPLSTLMRLKFLCFQAILLVMWVPIPLFSEMYPILLNYP